MTNTKNTLQAAPTGLLLYAVAQIRDDLRLKGLIAGTLFENDILAKLDVLIRTCNSATPTRTRRQIQRLADEMDRIATLHPHGGESYKFSCIGQELREIVA